MLAKVLYINSKKSWLLSPFIVILAGFFTALLFTQFIAEWAWVPVALVYWGMMGLVIRANITNAEIRDWLRPSKKCVWCIPLALLLGFIPFPMLMLHYNLFDHWGLVVLWFLFAIINPWFEEGYWRGLMLDTGKEHFSRSFTVLYSVAFFILAHPLTWGVFSLANRHPHLFIALTVMGLGWSAIYIRTKSLRWPIFSHVLVDIFNMTVLVFLNIYIPA